MSVEDKQAAHQSLAKQRLGRMRSIFFSGGAANPAEATIGSLASHRRGSDELIE